MAIASRGSRRITVDGVAYRWKVRRRPTYCQGNTGTNLQAAVELADAPGAKLVVELPLAHPSNWMCAPFSAALPSDMARAVRLALAAGWQPGKSGSPFRRALTPAEDSSSNTDE